MKNLTTDYKFNNIVESSYPAETYKDNKTCFLPVANNTEKYGTIKRSEVPIKMKPAYFFEDYAERGLDNPAYFDAIKLRKEERTATRKKKFSSLGIVPEDKSSSAKLTKIPGLNIWRLDFSKTDRGPVRRRRASSCYRFAVTIAMIVVLALLIVGVAVIVHAVKGGLIFGFPWFPFENEDADVGVNKVAAHFRIMNRYFTPELGNTSSEAYSQLVAELKLSLDIIFMDSPLVNYYNASNEFIFSNGSVVVQCVIQLNQAVLDGAQNVGFAFLRSLEKGKGILPPGRLYVDVHTVKFAAVILQIDENILQDLQGLEPWSEWSSCISDGICDAMRMRVRRRKCSSSPTQLCGEDTEVVETKPCTCQADVSVSTLMFSRIWSEWTLWSPCPDKQHCDRRNIQKRTRTCLGPGTRTIPSFLCSRGTGEAGTQIRHCPCTQSGDTFI